MVNPFCLFPTRGAMNKQKGIVNNTLGLWAYGTLHTHIFGVVKTTLSIIRQINFSQMRNIGFRPIGLILTMDGVGEDLSLKELNLRLSNAGIILKSIRRREGQ